MNLRKPARVNLLYWTTVLAACSIGETFGDLVSHELGLGYVKASALFLCAFGLLFAIERKARVRSEARYWAAIVTMSTTGTALADLFTRTLHFGYAWTSLFLTGLFAGVLLVARLARRTDAAPGPAVAPAQANLPAADAGYWAAIMVASTLGTSLGDFVSNVLKVGFGGGTLLLGTLLAGILLAEQLARNTSAVRYWAALLITSTIGATSGDYLTKEDGLHLPFALVIVAQVALFVGLILVAAARRRAPAVAPQAAPAREAPAPSDALLTQG